MSNTFSAKQLVKHCYHPTWPATKEDPERMTTYPFVTVLPGVAVEDALFIGIKVVFFFPCYGANTVVPHQEVYLLTVDCLGVLHPGLGDIRISSLLEVVDDEVWNGGLLLPARFGIVLEFQIVIIFTSYFLFTKNTLTLVFLLIV